MGPKTMRTMVVLVALAVAGCGADGAGLGEDGTGGVSAVGTGGMAGVGGQGGAAPAGTGGANVSAGGTIGSDFTRADHDMCMNWPVCPPDVFSIRLTSARILLSQQCTAFDGGRLSCTGCLRRSTCESFTGRCIAPFLLTNNPDSGSISGTTVAECREFLGSNPPVVASSWAICTGDTAATTVDSSGAPQVGVNAKTVCQD